MIYQVSDVKKLLSFFLGERQRTDKDAGVTCASCSQAELPDPLELLLLRVFIPQRFLQAGVWNLRKQIWVQIKFKREYATKLRPIRWRKNKAILVHFSSMSTCRFSWTATFCQSYLTYTQKTQFKMAILRCLMHIFLGSHLMWARHAGICGGFLFCIDIPWFTAL